MALFDWEPETAEAETETGDESEDETEGETGDETESETPEEWERPTFRQCMEREIHDVFLCTDEFAANRTVIYDGVTRENVPAVELGPTEEKRIKNVLASGNDYAQGIYRRSVTFYLSAEDMDNVKPEEGTHISISDMEAETFFHKYRVAESTTEMGMYRLTLEEVDE